MKIFLVTIGQRLPSWVNTAYEEYAKRLPKDYELILKALPAEKRSKSSDTKRLLEKESSALFNACPNQSYRVALDREGEPISTQDLSKSLLNKHDQSQDIALMIGGPEGITPEYLRKADTIWSLSELTLPHPLVRVLVAEQIYRAWSILSNHPYHKD